MTTSQTETIKSIKDVNDEARAKNKTLNNKFSMFPVGTKVKVICVCCDMRFFRGDEIGEVISNTEEYLGINVTSEDFGAWGFNPEDLVVMTQQLTTEQKTTWKTEFREKFTEQEAYGGNGGYGIREVWKPIRFIYGDNPDFSEAILIDDIEEFIQQKLDTTRAEERQTKILVSWDTAEAKDNWVVQFWKIKEDGTKVLLTELNKDSDEGGNFTFEGGT